MAEHLILYDGLCGFCERLVLWLLKRDRRRKFRFAPLQSAFAKQALARHGKEAAELDTMCLLLDWGTPQERLLVKGRAAVKAAKELGGIWQLASALEPLPSRLLDFGYRALADRRYRLVGRLEACRPPDPEVRDRFLGH